MCHHNCHLNHKLPTFISLEHGTARLIKQMFFFLLLQIYEEHPCLSENRKYKAFFHVIATTCWEYMIDSSVNSNTSGRPAMSFVTHKPYKKRTKSKQAQTYQNCEVCWKISNGFGRRLLIEKKLYHFCDSHNSEQEEVLCTQKNGLLMVRLTVRGLGGQPDCNQMWIV